jgi:hypothetical protein
MRIVITVILLAFQFFTLNGQEFNQKYGNPIVKFFDADPNYEEASYTEIGLDVPLFVLYENGQILFRKIIEKKIKIFETQINKKEIKGFLKKIGFTDRLITKVPNDIVANEATCQAFTVLRLDTTKRIWVYGNIRNKKSKDRKKVPIYFLTIYDNLIDFNTNESKEWKPEYFKVLLTDYSYSLDIPLKWPEKWADLNSSNSQKLGQSGYAILLENKYFMDFYKLISELKEKQAIIINGKKFSPSFKFCFPNLDK